MVNIPDDESGIIPEFFLRFVDRDDEFNIAVPSIVFLKSNRVKIGSRGFCLHESLELINVLFGPFDL